jgi:RNA polymerase primary sigma factor
MASESFEMERALIARVVAGEPAAIDRFLDLAERPVWTAASALAGSGRAGEAAYRRVIDALREDGFARLAAYKGRSSLAAFLALTCRAVLIEDLAVAFAAAPASSWPRFQRLFARDIRRRIQRLFPRADDAARDDHYQNICLDLLEDDFKRLRKFTGKGNFEGFVLVTVNRLLIDLMRKEAGRLRLPAAVEAMEAIEQDVFKAVAWKGAPADGQRLLAQLGPSHPGLDLARIETALGRVRGPIDTHRAAVHSSRSVSIDAVADDGRPFDPPDTGRHGDTRMIDHEEAAAQAAVIAAIKAAVETMPPEERAYMQVYFSSAEALPPREIARRMGRPVEDVTRIHARVMRKITPVAQAATKNDAASV